MSLSDTYQFGNFDDLKKLEEKHKLLSSESFKFMEFDKTSTPNEIKAASANFDFPDFEKSIDSAVDPLKIQLEQQLKDVSKLKDQAQQKLKDADNAIANAKEKAKQIELDAYKEGLARGEKDGKEIGIKKIDSILDTFAGSINDILAYKNDFPKIYEKEIIGLIRQIAEKVIHVKVKVDHKIVLESILEAFNILSDKVDVKITINPEDMAFVNEYRPEFFLRIKGLKSVTIESDQSVGRGGCLLETQYGDVDARIESQFEMIKDAILSVETEKKDAR